MKLMILFVLVSYTFSQFNKLFETLHQEDFSYDVYGDDEYGGLSFDFSYDDTV